MEQYFRFFKSMKSLPFYNIGTLLAAIAKIETSIRYRNIYRVGKTMSIHLADRGIKSTRLIIKPKMLIFQSKANLDNDKINDL